MAAVGFQRPELTRKRRRKLQVSRSVRPCRPHFCGSGEPVWSQQPGEACRCLFYQWGLPFPQARLGRVRDQKCLSGNYWL